MLMSRTALSIASCAFRATIFVNQPDNLFIGRFDTKLLGSPCPYSGKPLVFSHRFFSAHWVLALFSLSFFNDLIAPAQIVDIPLLASDAAAPNGYPRACIVR